MRRWLELWRLRRARARLQAEMAWLRDTIWTYQAQLEEAGRRERHVQGEIWALESPKYLLDPSRTVSGTEQSRR